MKAMKKKMYVSPEMEIKLVELENGFMSGSANVQNPDEDNGRIESHKVNEDFNFSFNQGDGWDSEVQQ